MSDPVLDAKRKQEEEAAAKKAASAQNDSEERFRKANEGVTKTSEAHGTAPRVIEVGASNHFGARQPMESHDVQIIHQTSTAGHHRLILESREGKPAVYSPDTPFNVIAVLQDPVSGIKYCATTEHFRDSLPVVFQAVEVEYKQAKY